MRIHETTLQQKNAHYPSALDFKRIVYRRSRVQTTTAKKELYRLEMGHFGEEKLVEKLRSFGQDHWIILRNTWFSDGRTFECDVILITFACVYVFEVKNFRGDFHYQNASSSLNGVKLDYDYIQQARKSILKMKKILNEWAGRVPVKGALVFVGEDNRVSIGSAVEDIEILTATDLYSYILGIVREERACRTGRLDAEGVIGHLERYEILSPFLPEPLSESELGELRGGIYCDVCGNFDLKFNQNYSICPGCLKEPRQESVVRMALEYGALTYNRNFSTVDVERFIQSQASRKLVRKTFKQHMNYVSRSNASYVNNNTPLYYKSCKQFFFEYPRIQKVDRTLLIGG